MLKGHGDDGYAQQTAIGHDFSSNVCRDALPEGLQEYLRQHLETLTHYPEPASESLRALIAGREGITVASVLVTNGATEGIYLTAQAFARGVSYVLQPTFSEYADACRLAGHQVKGIRHLNEVGEDATMVWLCNPNNPTGTVISKGELLLRIAAHPDVVFVVDQSYEAFCREPLLSVGEASAYGNLLLLHSMTKQYALPGLRLGYLTGAEKLVAKVEHRLQPWSVNVLAQRAGEFILEERGKATGRRTEFGNERKENSIEWSVDAYLEETQRLRAAIGGIDGMEALPTATSFFLVRLEEPSAGALKQWLAGEGILIRDASNFEGLDGHYIRIAAQRPEENDLLIEKLKEWSMR